MPTACDREGNFKAEIVGYGVKEMESGSVSISLRARLREWFSNGEWHPWEEFDMEAEGDIWIVKKDGSANEPAVLSLANCCGWDGDLSSIVNETWQPTRCQVVVKKDEYKGNVRFKIAFLNDHDRTPGGMSNLTPDKARALTSRFGPQFRAIVGTPAPKASPPTPYTKPADVEGEKIPF